MNVSDPLAPVAAGLHFALVTVFGGYITPVMYVTGILGNLISVIIFVKRRRQDRVSSQYLGVLALSDLGILCVLAVPGYVMGFYKTDMPTNLTCKIWASYWTFSTSFSSWILVQFSLERVLVIWQPLRMGAFFQSAKPRKVGLVVLFLGSIAISCGHYHWIARRQSGSFYRCLARDDLPLWDVSIGNFVSHGIPNAIPLLIITVLNVLLIVGLKRNQMTDGTSKTSKNDRKIIINLILISTFFFIFITPTTIINSLYYYLESTRFAGLSPSGLKIFLDMMNFGRKLATYNSIINSWVYTFSLDFYRAALLEMLGCRKGDKSKT